MTAGSGSESGTSAGEQWAAEQQIREEELDLQRAAQLRLDKELTFKIEEASALAGGTHWSLPFLARH